VIDRSNNDCSAFDSHTALLLACEIHTWASIHLPSMERDIGKRSRYDVLNHPNKQNGSFDWLVDVRRRLSRLREILLRNVRVYLQDHRKEQPFLPKQPGIDHRTDGATEYKEDGNGNNAGSTNYDGFQVLIRAVLTEAH
jgi:hypothetical protein